MYFFEAVQYIEYSSTLILLPCKSRHVYMRLQCQVLCYCCVIKTPVCCVWSRESNDEKPLAPLATNEEVREALISVFFLASTLTKQAYHCLAIMTPVEQCAWQGNNFGTLPLAKNDKRRRRSEEEESLIHFLKNLSFESCEFVELQFINFTFAWSPSGWRLSWILLRQTPAAKMQRHHWPKTRRAVMAMVTTILILTSVLSTEFVVSSTKFVFSSEEEKVDTLCNCKRTLQKPAQTK